MFFAISGYLVARSFDRSASLVRYVRARALRILPAYVVATLYAAFVIGPWATTLPVADYLADPRTWLYVRETLLFVGVDRLPGVFADNPYPNAVNGSLWTLWLEVFVLRGARARGPGRRVAAPVARARAGGRRCSRWPSVAGVRRAGHAARRGVPRRRGSPGRSSPGALAYAWRDRIPLSPWLALAALAAGVALLGTRARGLRALRRDRLCDARARRTTRRWTCPGFRRFGDYSYGIYVYAYPTQQAIASVLGPMPSLLLFGLAYPVVVRARVRELARVERPALRFKREARRAPMSMALNARCRAPRSRRAARLPMREGCGSDRRHCARDPQRSSTLIST